MAASEKFNRYVKDKDLLHEKVNYWDPSLTEAKLRLLNEKLSKVKPAGEDCKKHMKTLKGFVDEIDAWETLPEEKRHKIKTALEGYEAALEELKEFTTASKDILGIS